MIKYCCIILTFLNLAGCTHSFDKPEAIRSLKVLNSDLSQFFLETNELPEMEVFRILWSDSTAPLPFPNEKFIFSKPYLEYDFQNSKGHYRQDSIKKQFIRTGDNESVVIEVSSSRLDNCRFELQSYETMKISSRPSFPIKARAILFADSLQILNIEHEAAVADELPLFIRTSIEGTQYRLNATFDRIREGNRGSINAKSSIISGSQNIVDLEFDSKIGYSSMGYYFEKINFNITLFHHLIIARIDYDHIDPTSSDYISSFNKNSEIEIFERPYRKKVGNIRLGTTNNGELIDYFIEFRNGDTAPLAEYIPGLQKILNLKL
ncbi:MAG TPA: hypothetical protein DCY35_04875 [Prolixibacteraceae bacterium]|nr:hypothetical protein [Prolixibacteraceae bacterium]